MSKNKQEPWILATSSILSHPTMACIGGNDKDKYDYNEEAMKKLNKSQFGKATIIGWSTKELSKKEVVKIIQKEAFSSALFESKVHKEGQRAYARRDDDFVMSIGNVMWFDIDEDNGFNPDEFYKQWNGKIDFIILYGQSSPLGKTSYRVLVRTPVAFGNKIKGGK